MIERISKLTDMLNNKIKLNKYGYYEVTDKPSSAELQDYYSKKYYQVNSVQYTQDYTDEELTYMLNGLAQKYHVLQNKLGKRGDIRFLDLGCGEGWSLNYFSSVGWDVLGLDFSEHGIKTHNPDMLENFIPGDIYDNLNNLISENQKFDIILMDNVLEHVLNPEILLVNIQKTLKDDGILIIEVPNDYSKLHQYLFQEKHIDKEFWIALPDHLSYFNLPGLEQLCNDKGLSLLYSLCDYPIDLHLLNPNTNYVMDKSKGPSCHKTRVELENFLTSISIEKTVELYHTLSEMELGRNIISFFKKI